MNQAQLYSAEVAQDTLESLFAAHGPQRSYIYWTVLLGVIASLVALPLVKVDVSVRAQGMVRPRTERTELKSAVSGHTTQVLARDNDTVKAGQPLLILRTVEVEERIARNHAHQAERREAIVDLEGLVSPGTAEAGIDGRAFSTSQYRQEFAQLQAQLSSFTLAEQKARGELARYTALSAKGIATQQEFDNARYEVERLAAEKKLIVEQALARWQGTLHDEKVSLADLATEEQRLNEELTQFTLRSPADGVLIGFAGLSAGGFVAAGQVLGAVSPEDTLRVEAYVAPKDVGLIRVGQTARLQVDAFPYTQWGTLDGVVESVSGDMLNSGPGAACFSKSSFVRQRRC